ncbi:putative glycerol-3-phosphate transporter 2 [Impatiens glandulifera]|uniref:putative glycerol-3-phosphate transporter 2 n=1 Tax=Impatiens glandulifera TaxID=253017 RepID=UPI001FB16916|nr:putative glycerol-3-phosphate transporter 2 [Impatiens glandulifera]
MAYTLSFFLPRRLRSISNSFFPKFPATMKTRTICGISLSLIIINLASIMERADENLLPSVYKEVSEAFNAGPSDLGYLTFIRNFVQGLASPLAGILAINHDRPTVLAMGTMCWALSTAAVGVSQRFIQVAFWRAVNGFGLAIVIPALQSFIADSYLDGVRGAGFGFLNLVGMVGGIGGGVLATIMAGHEYLGIPGWRFAFVMMASLSVFIGCLVYLFVVDPRMLTSIDHSPGRDNRERIELLEKGNAANSTSLWLESWAATKAVIRVKTFQIIVLQGLVGSLPWTAMVFFTLWFELIGFDHNSTATLLSLFAAGCAMGSFLGGIIADRMSRVYPYYGRVICAQFSAFMGIPFSWFLLVVIPQSVSSYNTFCVTLFLMGLTISWNATAANGPMFAEVVPAKHRTMIYAFDRAFEVSFSSFAAPVVGILAEKMYGYDPKTIDPVLGSAKEAYALSRGLFNMMAVPFGLCCLFYTPLYWVFRRDRETARMSSLKEEEMF